MSLAITLGGCTRLRTKNLPAEKCCSDEAAEKRKACVYGKALMQEYTAMKGEIIMGMKSVNVRGIKKCAFCKFWDDPDNSAINPKSPRRNIWEYDNVVRCKCLKRDVPMLSSAYCHMYECKLELM